VYNAATVGEDKMKGGAVFAVKALKVAKLTIF
jgi:hypothetical protein